MRGRYIPEVRYLVLFTQESKGSFRTSSDIEYDTSSMATWEGQGTTAVSCLLCLVSASQLAI